MDWKEMVEIQDTYLEFGKEMLRKHGALSGVTFAISHKDLLPKDASTLRMQSVDGEADLECKDGVENVIVAAPVPNTPLEFCGAIIKLAPEAVASTVRTAIELAKACGVWEADPQGACEKILNGVKASTGMDDKDLQTRLLMAFLEKVGAYAYVHMDEAWTVAASNADALKAINAARTQSLADHPDRQECIVSMLVSRTRQRAVTLPFTRDENNNPVIGEPMVHETDSSEGFKVSGRLTELLPEVDPTALN